MPLRLIPPSLIRRTTPQMPPCHWTVTLSRHAISRRQVYYRCSEHDPHPCESGRVGAARVDVRNRQGGCAARPPAQIEASTHLRACVTSFQCWLCLRLEEGQEGSSYRVATVPQELSSWLLLAFQKKSPRRSIALHIPSWLSTDAPRQTTHHVGRTTSGA